MITRESIKEEGERLNLNLAPDEINMFFYIQKLPSLNFVSNVYEYKGMKFVPKAINLASRNSFLITYYKVVGKLQDHIKEYGQDSGMKIYLLESGKRTLELLLEGDFSKLEIPDDTNTDFDEFQKFVSTIMTDFFIMSRKFK
jgi:hypothetical protein